ncbi:very-long-chain (3R)-3-hydroxyacyl-CoA dehydratase 2-like [Lingula anatina]|uniref:Very-long-chain (3R)-3-hydroxyacyl-CoA dehydratase n=1 Tax=Lingula anatina TaxID=7574 RepID=A0A1S3IVN0_LINAN|nr:very-long-chain (3R)-3-hydroxyacyl-CoA dehydratase 2-like [Lingula anatina]|eukprot:XP_013402118.1 very-long-chain (3R)-3-hydroxyacyl-CoA dehydratase 2-like [Lingula anatina]
MAQRSQQSSLAKAYLLLYNIGQTIGWSCILFLSLQHYLITKSWVGLYRHSYIQLLLEVFQTLAYLEVLHCVLGLVKSNWFLTAVQIFSRVFLTWGVVWSIPEVQDGWFVACFLLPWTLTEIIRYSFYALNLLNSVPYFLIWCRYTFFIVLYPIGVSGELFTQFSALPYIKKTAIYTYPLPNRMNMSFDYYTVVIILMLSYIPLFPMLYFHMIGQRKKVLRGLSEKKED